MCSDTVVFSGLTINEKIGLLRLFGHKLSCIDLKTIKLVSNPSVCNITFPKMAKVVKRGN